MPPRAATCGSFRLRRGRGACANRLGMLEPHRAHAVLTPLAAGHLMASVRCPAGAGASAVDFCREFEGGGRATAAGIDRLEPQRLDAFIEAFDATWPGPFARAAKALEAH